MFRRRRPDALVVYGTKAFANVALMRLLAEEGLGADVSTLGELAFARRGRIEGGTSSSTATTSRTRSFARPPTRARSSCWTRPTSRRAPPRPASSACWCASPPASTRRRTRRSEPATTARSSGWTQSRRDRRRPRRPRVRPRRRRAARACRLAAGGCARASGRRRAAGRVRRPLPRRARLGTGDDRRRRRLRRPARAGGARTAGRRARARDRRGRRARMGAARPVRAPGDRRAGSRARRARRVHAVPGRRGEASRRPPLRRDRRRHVGQPPPSALRRQLRGSPREQGGRGAGGRVHDRRQALRVGRRPDRRRRASRCRVAATCSQSRRPAHTRSR